MYSAKRLGLSLCRLFTPSSMAELWAHTSRCISPFEPVPCRLLLLVSFPAKLKVMFKISNLAGSINHHPDGHCLRKIVRYVALVSEEKSMDLFCLLVHSPGCLLHLDRHRIPQVWYLDGCTRLRTVCFSFSFGVHANFWYYIEEREDGQKPTFPISSCSQRDTGLSCRYTGFLAPFLPTLDHHLERVVCFVPLKQPAKLFRMA
jgi:hypothetical protein